jgi:hypothetical protein
MNINYNSFIVTDSNSNTFKLISTDDPIEQTEQNFENNVKITIENKLEIIMKIQKLYF